MQISLISTSINVPKVLALYRKLGPDVKFFVAIDEKTPEEAINFCRYDIPNCEVLFIQDQQKWKCSELLGWNNDSRRDIALLEAVKWGAEIIVSIDDDMIPLGLDFFERFEIMLSEPYSGLQFGSPGEWCDVGKFTLPSAAQRGLPLGKATANKFSFVNDVQIGAMQGIILGTPDTDAGTTMALRPFVHSATDILRHGFVIDPLAKSVMNSQITAFRRELAPCFAQFYRFQGRNTDIMASLIMRRIMRERGFYTYFGPPFGFHNRSERDPKKDLEAEKWGVKNVELFSNYLDGYVFEPGINTPLEQTRDLYEDLEHAAYWPKGCSEAALAFLEDMESVL